MRILLIYPPIRKKERYSSTIGQAGGNQIPLGVFYLASYLRQFDHEVNVIDGEAHSRSSADILNYIREFKPELVGISSTTVAFHRSLEISTGIKTNWPNLLVVLGGPHISSNVTHAMSFASFDFGVIGEGELTLKHLVDALHNEHDLSSVQGLAYRENRHLVINSPRTLIDDLSSIPFPAYDLISDISLYTPPPCNFKKQPAINIITSRGCPNLCTFCDRSVFGQKLRHRNPTNIADEIEYLVNTYNVREIAFVDDTFTYNSRKKLRPLFEILNDRGIFFPWTCMSSINTVDIKLLKFMKEHGCSHISFGIESGSEDILKLIKKNTSLDCAKDVINWCAEIGIQTKGFFMIGHPQETHKSMEQTIQLALDLPLNDVVVTINTPIPGSIQYKEAKQYGSLDETDWSKFNYWRPVFVPKGLTQETILSKHKEFYRKFYFRRRILWKYFLSFLSPTGPKRFWKLFCSIPYILGWDENG